MALVGIIAGYLCRDATPYNIGVLFNQIVKAKFTLHRPPASR